MSTATKFARIKLNEAFSPALGQVGCNNVYIKKENGVCPQVGTDEQYGIFWPDDVVLSLRLPEKILKNYR